MYLLCLSSHSLIHALSWHRPPPSPSPHCIFHRIFQERFRANLLELEENEQELQRYRQMFAGLSLDDLCNIATPTKYQGGATGGGTAGAHASPSMVKPVRRSAANLLRSASKAPSSTSSSRLGRFAASPVPFAWAEAKTSSAFLRDPQSMSLLGEALRNSACGTPPQP